jgi:Chaperone of endosialidase
MKIGTPLIKASVERPLAWSILILVAFALRCFALLSHLEAVVPPPDGGYPGFNTAEGQNALSSLTTGVGNTAAGWFSLFNNTDGSFNTAVGAGTLLFNVGNQSAQEGLRNTAVGTVALFNNTTGSGNTANGALALFSNTTGDTNTATGAFALQNNITGSSNTATGFGALLFNTEGFNNTAIGINALALNFAGSSNTAVGSFALEDNTGNNNAGVGFNALFHNHGSDNTAIGEEALFNNTSGNQNTALGRNAGSGVTTASHVICIGANVAGANVDNSCFIGDIRDALVAPDAEPVLVDSAGKLGTTSGSSRRFKHEIKPMDRASELILALHPVIFHYKSGNTNTPQFGLIAEEVADVNPDLVVRDKNGEIYTVRYDAVNAMLLNEFLKEHKKVDELEDTVAQQQNGMEALIARLDEQATQIQKMSAQIAVRRSTPHTVLNNHKKDDHE